MDAQPHTLTVQAVPTNVATPHGKVSLLAGYVGRCSCGAESQLYGIEEPVRQWHRWHLDPTGRIARGRR